MTNRANATGMRSWLAVTLWTSQSPPKTSNSSHHLTNGNNSNSYAEQLPWISRLRQLLDPKLALWQCCSVQRGCDGGEAGRSGRPVCAAGLVLGDLGFILCLLSLEVCPALLHYDNIVQCWGVLAFESVRARFKYWPYQVQPWASCSPSQSPVLLIGKMKVILEIDVSIINSS